MDYSTSVWRARLDDRAFFDKQARELDGFFERAAPIATQIKYNTINALAFEFGQKPGDVRRGADCSGWSPFAREVYRFGSAEVIVA